MDHHCCDPDHRDHDARMRRLRERLAEAESRARWAELNEGILADRLEAMRDRLKSAGLNPDA